MTRERIKFPDGRSVPIKQRRPPKPWMNFGTKERRCDQCRRTPPVCTCIPKES